MSKPDFTFSKVNKIWDYCLCVGCFPVSYFPIPDGFRNAKNHHEVYNMVNNVLEDRIIDIMRGLDAKF